MKELASTRLIAHDPDKVFAAAKQVERFPDVLPDLNRVTIIEEKGENEVVTKWEGTINVGPLTRNITWTERDVWDPAARTCTFELIEGDMKEFSGVWTFTPEDGGCRVDLKIDFELGIPMLGPMITRIVDGIMQQNCDGLLEALEKLAAEQ
ncbi:SRPBCC family protein [bacterium]|nr:SRPBCC family protein [bacterium]